MVSHATGFPDNSMFVFGLFFILLVYWVGNAIVRFFVGRSFSLLNFVLSFITGVLISSWVVFLGSLLFSNTEYPMLFGNLTFLVFVLAILWILQRRIVIKPKAYLLDLISFLNYSKKNLLLTLFWALLFIFFLFLMYHSFSYDSKIGVFHIAVKSWSDFATHMATIRSFSLGHNFPPESPLYAGEFFRYHFLLWFFVANLEFLGLPLHHALNIFTGVSLLALVFTIYSLAKLLTKKESVAIVAVILFLLNGSLAFYRLLDWQSLIGTWENIFQHIASNTFLSSGLPFRGEGWGLYSLNIYTNQRHFPFAMAVFGSLLIVLIKYATEYHSLNKRIFLYIGIMIGLMPLAEVFTFMTLSIVFFLFFLFSKLKLGLLLTGIIAFLLSALQMYFLRDPSGQYPKLNLGYTFEPTLENFLLFLGIIFGAKLLFFFIGFFASSKEGKRLALITLTIFLFPLVVRLGPEQIHGHKFFNLWLPVAYPFIALGLEYIIQKIRILPLKAIVAIIALIALGGAGTLDTIAIARDTQMTFPEKSDSLFRFVKNQTPKDAVFLTDESWHSPIVYAGRKLFLGNGYTPWSFGYDARERIEKIKAMFAAKDQEQFCRLAKEFSIDYIMLDQNSKYRLENKEFFDQHFPLVFQRDNSQQFVYNIDYCWKSN